MVDLRETSHVQERQVAREECDTCHLDIFGCGCCQDIWPEVLQDGCSG